MEDLSSIDFSWLRMQVVHLVVAHVVEVGDAAAQKFEVIAIPNIEIILMQNNEVQHLVQINVFFLRRPTGMEPCYLLPIHF